MINAHVYYFALYGSQHMTFFYLPDEVKYHRLPTRYFSLPTDKADKAFECERFEVVTAAVRAQSTSQFSEPEFVCTPGEVNGFHSLFVFMIIVAVTIMNDLP